MFSSITDKKSIDPWRNFENSLYWSRMTKISKMSKNKSWFFFMQLFSNLPVFMFNSLAFECNWFGKLWNWLILLVWRYIWTRNSNLKIFMFYFSQQHIIFVIKCNFSNCNHLIMWWNFSGAEEMILFDEINEIENHGIFSYFWGFQQTHSLTIRFFLQDNELNNVW